MKVTRAFIASLAMLLTRLSLQAQTPPPAPDPAQDPAAARAVARISVMNGVVSVRRGDSGEAVAAAVNAPLTGTDRLFTGDGSRAEIQFDALNMIRLAPATEVRLGELAYHHYQVQIAGGTTEFRVLRDNDAEIEISTPSIAVHPLKHGIYRITVKPDGSSEVTVREGEVEISSPKGTEKLGQGKTMEARGAADNPEFQTTGAIAGDAWDKWNADRDHDLEKSVSGRYVNPDINGTEELDANGRWVNDPAYGQVWVPTVDPGWAPYRVGRWVWVDYYGWTWVSADPWGWAPYHYGRWYQGPYGWAWWPGAIAGPYYWQPALVGFFGWGGVGIGFGFGNIGWVGLAPYERFYPGYGAGIYGRGFGAMNVVRNTNVGNIYRNARVANGVTSMASNQFGRSGVTTANYVHASSADLAKAGSVRGGVPMTPSRESTHFSSAAAGATHGSESSHFYSSRASSSVSHVSFDQQRQAMARSASSMAARSAAPAPASAPIHTSTNSVSPPNRGTTPAAPSAPATQSGGWQRFSGNNSGASGHSQPVRINPSVVQSRTSAPSNSSNSSGRGASSSAPHSSAPRGGRR
ncbi:MAG: FecR family protein [Bryobacteraceae bacterium]